MSKPTCKVGGNISPGRMCAYIIVGGSKCAFSGDCQHKSCAEMIVEKVKEDAAANKEVGK